MAEPAYRRVADSIRAAIERGELEPGQRLEKTEDIARRYEVSKETAHRAIRHLTAEGLVTATRSQGIYVRERPRDKVVVRDRTVYRDNLGYFFDRNAQDWRAMGTPRRSMGVPPDHVAELLGVPRGQDVLVRHRLMGPPDGNKALQVAISYLSIALVNDLPIVGAEKTGPGGIYDRIEEHFDTAIEWHETISARLPDDEEQSSLGLGPMMPVLVVTRSAIVILNGEQRVVEVNETCMAAEQFAVSYTVQRDTSAAWPREEATR
jgi:GntR family transcriptional regulator